MKKLLLCFAVLFFAANVFAQKADTNSGQSAPSSKAKYVLGLVRNNDAARLNTFLDKEPWAIQEEINVYKDADKDFTISVFCVAVDLGFVDVVKAFVAQGYGPADLCRVQTFTTKQVVISKADFNANTRASAKSSSESSSSWMGKRGQKGGSSSSSSASVSASANVDYHQVFYDEKEVIKTYFANPLDFATGEMFDYLWDLGFRSNNLFTEAALADAKNQGRMDVWHYIMDNKPESLSEKPSLISEQAYRELLQMAQKGPDTLAYKALEQKLLGKTTSKQTADVRKELKDKINAEIAKGIDFNPNDTIGYSFIDKQLEIKEQGLKKQEAASAKAKKDIKEHWNSSTWDNDYAITPEMLKTANMTKKDWLELLDDSLRYKEVKEIRIYVYDNSNEPRTYRRHRTDTYVVVVYNTMYYETTKDFYIPYDILYNANVFQDHDNFWIGNTKNYEEKKLHKEIDDYLKRNYTAKLFKAYK